MNWGTVLTKEFISLFGFIILFLFVKNNNKMGDRDKRLFYYVIATGIAELVAFEAELWTASLAYPTFLRVLLSVIGYSLRSVLVYQLILISGKPLFTAKKKSLLLIPCLFCTLSVSTAFFSKIAFWYDSANQFHRGVLGYVPHVVGAFYFMLFAYVTCKNAGKKGSLEKLIAVGISAFAVCALLVDTFISAGGTTRIAIMLCTFYAYVQIQNSALFSLIDDIPGAIAKFTLKNGVCRLVSFNDSLCQMFGMSREDFVFATRQSAFSPLSEEYRKKAEEAVGLLYRQDRSAFRFKLTSGDEDRYYSVALKVTQRTENEIHIYGTMLDITAENKTLNDLRMKNDEISLLMEQIGKIVCIYDIPTKTLTMTDAYAKMRGYSSHTAIVPEEACARHLVSDESKEQYLDFYNRIFAGEHSGSIVAKFISPDGTEYWEKTHFVTVLDQNGQAKRAIISIEDITEAYEEKLLLDNYRSTLDSLIGDDKYFILYDITERKIVACEGTLLPNAANCQTLGELVDDWISHYVKDCDADVVRELLSPESILASYETGILHRHIERMIVLPNGTEKWFRLNVNIDSVNGKKPMATLLLIDIDSEYRAKNDLVARANHDALTGLLTRDATMQEIESYLTGEGKNGTHALVMLDIDNLKPVNDTLGHQFGDVALQNFAGEVKGFFREEDIIGRIGGDEFFVFAKNINGAVLSPRMHELLRNLERVYSDGGKQVTATASAGIAMYHGKTDQGKTLTNLYAEADVALYKSKSLGKNTFTFSDELEQLATDTSTAAFLHDNLVSYNLKGLLDNLANGVAIFHGTAQGEITPMFCNKKLPLLLHISHEQFAVHMSPENKYAIHPDDIDQTRNTLGEAIQTGNSIRQVLRIRTGNGDYRYVTVFSNAHRLADGSFDLYCVFTDAEEAEQLHRIHELRHRHLEKRLTQAVGKNEAYVLLNITQNICVERFHTHVTNHIVEPRQTAQDVLDEIAEDIATEEHRKVFLEKFSMDVFFKDVKEGIVAKEMRLPFLRKGKSPQWYCLKTELSFDPNTGDIEVFGVFTDISNEIRLEYAINRLLDNEYEYICEIDVESGCMAKIGESAEDKLPKAYNGDIMYTHLLPRAIKTLLPVEHRANAFEALSLSRILTELDQRERYTVVFPMLPENGREERLCQWSCEYMDNSHSTILMCRKNISSILDYGYDTLTGMLGRKGFYRKVRNVLNEDPSGGYFIVETDFDNFSLVNETKGYSEGNRFIRQFGADVLMVLKAKGKGCYIGHLEGDRFIFLCSSACIKTPEELYDAINAQLEAYPEIYHLKLRMGVYNVEDISLDTELMCDCAHLALDASKGRFDRFIFYYSVDLKDRMLDEQLLASEMQNAITTKQFEVWLQPQINHANKGTLIGAEALVRWKHPTRGMISPSVFIPLFEQNGFIYELDKYVWRTACAYLRRWLDEGQNPLPLSVNVSRLDIMQADFLETVVSTVEEHHIPYELLHLEVTESAFADNSGKVVAVVNKLISMGFVVAIDDFGSGYSSLSMLKNVTAHFLKLDMRFFENQNDSIRNECIIESVVRMAKMLGMSVLAEGVESMEQANRLCTLGCDYVQGYLYARPLSYEEYAKYAGQASGEVIHRASMATREERATASAKNQELFRSIISGTNDVILVADVHTKQLLYANRAAEQYYGKVFDPMKMTTCSAYCGESEQCRDCPAQSLTMGEKKETVISENGTHMKALYTLMEWNGHEAFVFYQTDISAEMREMELTDSLIRNIPGAIITFSLNENNQPEVSYVSEQARAVFHLSGVDKKDFTLEDFFSVVHPDDRKRVERSVYIAASDKQPFHEEFRLRLQNGEIMWIDLIANPVALPNGRYQFYGIYTDTTDRNNLQQKADAIIQSIPSAMTIYAVNGQSMSRIFISDYAKKILGAEENTHDVVPMDIVYSRIHPKDRERIRSVTTDCIQHRLPFSLQFRIRRQDKEYRWVQLDSTPISRGEDECYFYSIYTDISAEKQMNLNKQEIQSLLSAQNAVNLGLRESLLQPTPEASISYILQFVGRTIGSERAYIFEKNADGTNSNTFEWVAQGITPEKDNLQNVPEEAIRPWYDAFKKQRVVVIENLEDIKQTYPVIYNALASQNIRSLVAAPFFDSRGEPMGFFGLDNPSAEALLNYPALTQTIAFFIEAALKRRN